MHTRVPDKYFTLTSTVNPSAASKTNPLPPRLTQHRLKAVVTAVSMPIEEGHVIILHIPVGIHHRSVGWWSLVHLIDEALPGGELTHQLNGRIIWIEAHRVRIMYHLGFRWVL